jgi:spectinomycin phosphotransferase
VLTPPPDFSTGLLTAALHEMWGVEVAQIDYSPVGFGSHHWSVVDASGQRWFATLDDYATDGASVASVGRGAVLSSAYRSARALADAGLEFVVAPRPARDGSVPFELARHRWLSVTPLLDAERLPVPEAQSAEQRRAVVEVIARIHAATRHVVGIAVADDLALPQRAVLDRALAGAVRPGAGPHGERARAALAEQALAVRSALTSWEEAARRAYDSRESWVVTHGEPHWRNVLAGAGGLHVVDWDTALLGPPARDLWHVAGADGAAAEAVLDDYVELTGRAVTLDDLAAQSLRWDLTEVALYVAWFSRPHADDADGEVAWGGFTESLSSLAARPEGA